MTSMNVGSCANPVFGQALRPTAQAILLLADIKNGAVPLL
jgi:hypothetical protein